MIKVKHENKDFATVAQSNYVKYLTKFGQICSVFVTENNGKAVLNRNMHIMMMWHGKEITVQRYRIGNGKPSYCAADSWDVFSAYSSQYVGSTQFFDSIEELMIYLEGLAYDAGLDM